MIDLQPQSTTVVLLAAGFGKRMLPLTETTPKPLLRVGKRALIEHHLLALKQQGFDHIVINVAHLGQSIIDYLGNGSNYGLEIVYSDERGSGPLETAGGIKNALPLINSEYFIVVNADIWTDFDFSSLLSPLEGLGKLVMVNNPDHNSRGDFSIDDKGLLRLSESGGKTFSGIAIYSKEMFAQLDDGKQALRPAFNNLIRKRLLEGVYYEGTWADVGTPERLDQLNKRQELLRNA